MKTHLLGALPALTMTGNALVAIKEEPVVYKEGETTMKGFIVYDDAKVSYRYITYPGAVHAFTNPEATSFFAEVFK